MLKKNQYKNNFRLIRFLNQKGLGTFPKILISSLLIISFFYSMPVMLNYSKNKSIEFKNNSKQVLAYTLNNNGKSIEEGDDVLNENDLLKTRKKLHKLIYLISIFGVLHFIWLSKTIFFKPLIFLIILIILLLFRINFSKLSSKI